jgi:hypothetical protein
MDQIVERLAAKIAATSGESHCVLGLDHEMVAQLKDLANTWKSGRKAGLIAFITLAVAFLVGLFGLGVVQKIREVVKP